MHSEKEIVTYIRKNFSPDRSELVKNLKDFKYFGGAFDQLFKNISQLKRPFDSYTGLTDDNESNINSSKPDLESIGDISDCYIILLNEELNHENFDMQDEYNEDDYEFRFVKFWVNWFIPVYSIQLIYDTYSGNGKRLTIGQIENVSKYESELIQKVKEIIETLGFNELGDELTTTKIKGTQTDCSDEGEATVFECLFSDAITPYPIKETKNIKPLRSKSDPNSYFEPKSGDTYFIIKETVQLDGKIELEEIEVVKK